MSSAPEKSISSVLLETYFAHGLTAAPAKLHFPQSHLRMLADRARLQFYRDILQSSVRGKVVLDVGAGSGVLTHLALAAGATHVYAVEHSELLQTLLGHMLRSALDAGRVTLLKKDATLLVPQDFAHGAPQVVVSELFSADLFREKVIEIHAALKKNLPGLRLSFLPEVMELWASPAACPGLDESFPLEDFEGFPLASLNGLRRPQTHWVDYRLSRAFALEDTGPGVLAYRAELSQPELPGDLEFDLALAPETTHLRLSFRLLSGGLEYDSSRLTPDSHWANLLVKVPPPSRRAGPCRVTLNSMNNGFQTATFR